MPVSAPELAIRAFEAATGTHVVLHDLVGRWWARLPPERGAHRQPLCQAVKGSPHAQRCQDLEIAEVRQTWMRWPEGRVHRCHAGLVEWIMPLVDGDTLIGMCFAGQRRTGEDLVVDLLQKTSPAARLVPRAKGPPPVGAEESARILELLRQLAARLTVLALRVETPLTGRGDRWWRCERFLHERHADPDLRLDDLAAHLSVSPGRLAHLLQERGEGSFVERLTIIRLRTAAGLLRSTDLPVAGIALAAGFGDLSNFHRAFRRAFATTPLRYRHTAAS